MTHLGQVITAYQQKFGVEGKSLARRIGIAESTLTRIKQGKMPDAYGFAKIVVWLTNKAVRY